MSINLLVVGAGISVLVLTLGILQVYRGMKTRVAELRSEIKQMNKTTGKLRVITIQVIKDPEDAKEDVA